ncbi:MAG: GNAT family N-acetyltransferase [Bacteroidetes bacterium GWE2_41_25]|nr:MAG: GNAT family N-acetyltransferase [Bacteroidetes bacterium GWA2_40_15]OFX98274.1 MAG: GNAT family N-acetyltransferase [Bacteroidetes bacterium GWC2_40_22]OFY11254.1 MAG: GNAT family N-acetyltransferase [Bacteroidetes bacterium GWE2_41_25]
MILRPWSIRDAHDLARIADNKNIADNLRDGFPNPYSLEDAITWLNIILPENIPPRFFAILAEKVIVGSIGIVTKTDIYRKNVEIGYYLAEDYWGKGIMTRAIMAATSYSFRQFDIVRVYAEPFADNPGSRRALEKAGFSLEATLKQNVIKNGIIKDSCIYSVLKEDFKFSLD